MEQQDDWTAWFQDGRTYSRKRIGGGELWFGDVAMWFAVRELLNGFNSVTQHKPARNHQAESEQSKS